MRVGGSARLTAYVTIGSRGDARQGVVEPMPDALRRAVVGSQRAPSVRSTKHLAKLALVREKGSTRRRSRFGRHSVLRMPCNHVPRSNLAMRARLVALRADTPRPVAGAERAAGCQWTMNGRRHSAAARELPLPRIHAPTRLAAILIERAKDGDVEEETEYGLCNVRSFAWTVTSRKCPRSCAATAMVYEKYRKSQ